MLWMMGYDYNHVVQELYDILHNNFESESNDKSSTSSDYDSDGHSWKDSHDNLVDIVDNGIQLKGFR